MTRRRVFAASSHGAAMIMRPARPIPMTRPRRRRAATGTSTRLLELATQASSRTALQATEAGFEVGTRTTVDVLQSRRQLFDAQTNYSRSRYDYILTVLQLQLATGTLDRADLEKINAFLKERAITR